MYGRSDFLFFLFVEFILHIKLIIIWHEFCSFYIYCNFRWKFRSSSYFTFRLFSDLQMLGKKIDFVAENGAQIEFHLTNS